MSETAKSISRKETWAGELRDGIMSGLSAQADEILV